MRSLILATAILAIAISAMIGVAPGFARGGHGHSLGVLSAPANPSVPPSLTPDARLTGSAPLPSRSRGQLTRSADTSSPVQLDPEDAKVNKMIKNICRGC